MEQLNLSEAPNTIEETPADGETTLGDGDGFGKFVIALYCMISVVGITGNLLVAIVLLRVPSLRSNTSDFLVHLSIVDFMVCVLVIPYFLAPKPNPTPNPGLLGVVWCRLYKSKFPFWLFTMTSVLGLTAVNLERYVAIVYPHKYKMVFSKQNKYAVIAVCWMLGAITKLERVIVYKEDEVIGCHRDGWSSGGAQAVFGLYTFTVSFFAPFIVMILAQVKVISKLNRQVKMLTARTG